MNEVNHIDYQSFSKLVERLAIYTERLEHVTSDLKEFRNQHKSEMEDLDRRVRFLEEKQSNHNTVVSFSKYIIGGMITAITMFFYYRMGGHE